MSRASELSPEAQCPNCGSYKTQKEHKSSLGYGKRKQYVCMNCYNVFQSEYTPQQIRGFNESVASEGGLGSGRKDHQPWMREITQLKTNKHKIPSDNMTASKFLKEMATENSMCDDCMDNFLIKATEADDSDEIMNYITLWNPPNKPTIAGLKEYLAGKGFSDSSLIDNIIQQNDIDLTYGESRATEDDPDPSDPDFLGFINEEITPDLYHKVQTQHSQYTYDGFRDAEDEMDRERGDLDFDSLESNATESESRQDWEAAKIAAQSGNNQPFIDLVRTGGGDVGYAEIASKEEVIQQIEMELQNYDSGMYDTESKASEWSNFGEPEDQRFTIDQYSDNEDSNFHADNALGLVKQYGTQDEYDQVNKIINDSGDMGYSVDDRNKRDDIAHQYWQDLKRDSTTAELQRWNTGQTPHPWSSDDSTGFEPSSSGSGFEATASEDFWDVDSSYGVKSKDELVHTRLLLDKMLESPVSEDARQAYQLKLDDVKREEASLGDRQLGQTDADSDKYPYFDRESKAKEISYGTWIRPEDKTGPLGMGGDDDDRITVIDEDDPNNDIIAAMRKERWFQSNLDDETGDQSTFESRAKEALLRTRQNTASRLMKEYESLALRL